MAEKRREKIFSFNGSVVTRVQPHLVRDPDAVKIENIDPASGALVPLKQDTTESLSCERSFTRYKNAWVCTPKEATYLEHSGNLYLTDSQIPMKRYSYLGEEYEQRLGIAKPDGGDASTSFYYGHTSAQPYIDAFFIEPYLIGLRGEENATSATHIDVYLFAESGIELRGTRDLSSSPFGTKLFCHVLDSTTIAIFVMGDSAIEWFKYSIASDTFTAQSDITLSGGITFTSLTGDHTSGAAGKWMSGAQSGSRWDSGWVLATGAEQIDISSGIGTNLWGHADRITAKDESYAESGDVDSGEAELAQLIARFPVITPPAGVESFYLSVRCRYKWGSGQDWQWNKIRKLQLYYDGWIGDNFGDESIYRARKGSFSGVINTGDWGIENGITRDMLESGQLGFGFDFQSKNNGRWYVDYAELRAFGLIPAEGEDTDRFEFYAGTTEGVNRYVVNSATGVRLLETWHGTKSIKSVSWESDNVSVLYTESDGSNPMIALYNIATITADKNVLLPPTACAAGSAATHDPHNNIYVAAPTALSTSGKGEVACYDGAAGVELARVVLPDTIGSAFPTGMCADDYRVYLTDDYGSYSSMWSYLAETLEASGKITGVYAGNSYTYGKAKSIRRCGAYILIATSSTVVEPDENEFKGIWLYRANVSYLPVSNHYSPSKNKLNGAYSYGVTFYNERDNTESEMTLIINDAYVVNGFFDLTNIPQPDDEQVTHVRLYRVGGALTAFSVIAELEVGVTTYQDLVPDSLAGSANGSYGRYPPPQNLQCLTEVFGTFFGIADAKLYYTTQANPNYWTLFPLDLGAEATGLAICAQGLLPLTKEKSYYLSGTTTSAFRLYPLHGDQGCVSPWSVQPYSDGSLWMSSDGLCFSNGGKVQVLSKEQLGKITFSGIRASAVYDEVYYMAHSSGVFIADFRHNNTVRFRTLSDTDIDGMGVFDDILYLHKDGTGSDAAGLYSAFTAEKNRRALWRSGQRVLVDPGNLKRYKHLKLWYKGRPTLSFFIDGQLAGKRVALAKADKNNHIDIDLPHVSSGRFIEYLFEGDYELHYLEEVIDVNKR